MLLPSAVFWRAGVVKEALAMFGLEWTFLGLQWIPRRERRARGALEVGGVFVLNIRLYIMIPFGVAYGL